MTFNDAFAYVVGEEGKLSLDPNDPGNLTGGQVGDGVLRGTKYGISAAAYPHLDIPNLSLETARQLAKTKYWDVLDGDSIPYGVALLMFDFGYNAGDREAVVVAQRALFPGMRPDGILGPRTLAAFHMASVKDFALEFTAYRLRAYSEMPLWANDGLGWTRRAILTYTKAIA